MNFNHEKPPFRRANNPANYQNRRSTVGFPQQWKSSQQNPPNMRNIDIQQSRPNFLLKQFPDFPRGDNPEIYQSQSRANFQQYGLPIGYPQNQMRFQGNH